MKQPTYDSVRSLAPRMLPPLCPRREPAHPHRPDVELVAARMPTDPLELENISMYGFGAIPNLGFSGPLDAPLKQRLRPRRDKVNSPSSDADVIFVGIDSRQRQRPNIRRSSVKACSPADYTVKPMLKPKLGDASLPIEIVDGSKSPGAANAI